MHAKLHSKSAALHVEIAFNGPIYRSCFGSGHYPIIPPIGRFLPQTEPHFTAWQRIAPGLFSCLFADPDEICEQGIERNSNLT